MLTYEELHRQLVYNKLTGVFRWKISNTNSVKIGSKAGCIDKLNGYAVIGINNQIYLTHRLAWFYEYGYMPENMIDHIDRIKHHNWILNLRETSRQCNLRNTGNPKDNTSGVKGVYFCKKSNKWYAQIPKNKKQKVLGYYKDFDDAVCARLAGEQCLAWESCDSNSPAFQYVTENIQGERN